MNWLRKAPVSVVLVEKLAGEGAGLVKQSMMELVAAQLVMKVAAQGPTTVEVAIVDCLQQL